MIIPRKLLMIRVKKPLSKRPRDWHASAAVETAKAIAHFRNRRTKRKKFAFRTYKDERLKSALHKIFEGKCAYCEVDYAADGPGEVEHFRPKGRVSDGNKIILPGYYWLAAEWKNLFPSCIDCNRCRRHDFPGGMRELRGKRDLFPISNPRQRARRPGQETRERVLLLDPSRTNPERHLEFARDGRRVGVIRPALFRSGRESAKGKQSILVYGLDRPGLIRARKDHAVRVRYAMFNLCRACRQLEKWPNRPELQRELERHVRALSESFLKEDKVFLGMVRQLVFPLVKVLMGRRSVRPFAARLRPVVGPPGWPGR